MKTTIPYLDDPNVIETLNYDAIYEKRKVSFLALWPESERQAWADTLELESEPVVKLLQESAYLEMLLRARINDVARANLLAYAYDRDLNRLAEFYGVTRLSREQDEAFRLRIRERIRASSTAGPAAHYRYHTLSASPFVADAHIGSPRSGLVRIAIIARNNENNLIPADENLLSQVRSYVQKDSIKVLTDTVEVVAAQVKNLNVAANIWLLPGTASSELEQLALILKQTAKQELQLGRDLTRSWLIKTLHQQGVQRVEITHPAADVVVENDEAINIQEVNLTLAGTDY